ncbi:MAG TPA: hypothetical protein VGU20_17545 [Stellaceae bacterium]|nr:hypothetical protein [Stellaceae bacterium]
MFDGVMARIGGKKDERTQRGSAARLRQLDQELDQEQALQIGAAALGFLGAMLSVTVSVFFALLPVLAFATLGQFAFQGWSPALILLQRWGLRSSRDIDGERYAIAGTLAEPPLPAIQADAAD